MPARRIIQLGDPILRRTSAPLSDPAAARLVLRDLDATLREFQRTHGFGRGISAVQIGEPVRVIFLRVEGVPFELINPEFTWRSPETFRMWDDCFSFPNLMVRLERHRCIRLRHQTMWGEWKEMEAEGAMSELVQHEMDHLDGILAVDRAADSQSLATRDEWLRRLRFSDCP
jgi:peptide deformylase